MSGGAGGSYGKRRRFRSRSRRFRRFRRGSVYKRRYRRRRTTRSGRRNTKYITVVRKTDPEIFTFNINPVNMQLSRSWQFSLDNVATSLGSLSTYYEEYRIRKIYCTFEPKMPMPVASTVETSGNYQTWPRFLACVDYDDANIISPAQDPYNVMKIERMLCTVISVDR